MPINYLYSFPFTKIADNKFVSGSHDSGTVCLQIDFDIIRAPTILEGLSKSSTTTTDPLNSNYESTP
jgi:hypothetical protein